MTNGRCEKSNNLQGKLLNQEYWGRLCKKVIKVNGGGGGGVNRFSDRRISQKKIFGFRIWRIFYTELRILLIQQIADLINTADCGFI